MVFYVRSASADFLWRPPEADRHLAYSVLGDAPGKFSAPKVRVEYGRIGLVRSTSQDVFMREIQASDAKARLPQLLDDVERGETLIITRHGRAIARIVPEVNRRQEEVDRALASIRELRKRTLKVSIEEILSAKEEGRKH
jgi:prevent-host-death family protein